MVKVVMSGNYDGKPLEVLGNLIQERQRILNESAQDAVIATGINALMSLRTLTKVAKKHIPRKDVHFGREDPRYITGTRGKATGKVFRRVVVGRWKDGAKRNFTRWQEVKSGVSYTKRGKLRVKRATRAELVAAWNRWGSIRNRGLARRALGVAMNRLSTRNVVDPLDSRTARIAQANVRVRTVKLGQQSHMQTFVLEIRDGLGYAQQALRGGSAAVDLALKKAANRVAGRLCKVAEEKFGKRIATPFPEVKKRRVA